MIAHLQGPILWKDTDHLVVEVRGVGYELTCSQWTMDLCNEGEARAFWVYTHVREDSLQLFGFHSPAEKHLFLNLIKVNGIGPKSALNILSAGPLSDLSRFIDEGNVAALTKLPKVGKKIAETMVLTLKGKLGTATHAAPVAGVRAQIKSALMNLGFKPVEVESVLDQVDPNLEIQEGLRLGLSLLTK